MAREIVDFHSHFFSRPFFEALVAQSPREDPWGEIERRTPIELPGPELETHVARWTAELDRHGVDHLVTFASAPEEVPAVAEAARMAGGRISPIAFVNPAAGPPVESLLDDGFRGVLLFPALHHFRLADQDALLAPLNERKGIVYFHCGLLVVKLRDLLGLPRPYDLAWANPLAMIPAANAYPDVTFVIPHFGAGFFREALMAGTQCGNVVVDTSSSNSWVATQAPLIGLRDVFERALDVFGADRILFGTDSNVFPAGWRVDRLEEQRGLFESLGVAEGDIDRIFAGNARRLLG
ncbi:MAG: amidohydrolase family protein [Planctomycetota bacterium]|jgi:predicted TIM-barrel fold metal-dependent hydrolase